MFQQLQFWRSLALLCLLLLFWLAPFSVQLPPAFAANSLPVIAQTASATDWSEIDRAIAEAVRKVRPLTNEFAAHQLDRWLDERMQQVDDQFLEWYFSFGHQKATQDGVPFAWLAFQVDFLDLLSATDEKDLTPDQIIQKRLIEEFNQKFNELVLNEAAIDDLRDRIEDVAYSYAAALNVQLDLVRAKYHVQEQDWQRHIADISHLIYNTGTGQSSLSAESLSALLATKVLTIASVAIGSKLVAKFAVKMAPKLIAKGGATAIAELGAKLFDPLLVVGLLAWDVADYQQMVNHSRPELRQNIADYLETVKLNIFDAPDGSIMAAIDEVEEQIVSAIVQQTLAQAS